MTVNNSSTVPKSTSTLNRDELYEVCLVVNGPLEMSTGKIAGQTFQVAARWILTQATQPATDEIAWAQKQNVGRWFVQGTRTIVREAKTKALFERVVAEVPGFVMKDEGHTEVEPDSPTVFMSLPYLHKDRPKVLDNKKVKLL